MLEPPMTPRATITLAWTGASGFIYGLRVLESLLAAKCRVYVLCSAAARIVAQQELDLQLPSEPHALESVLQQRYAVSAAQLRVFGREAWFAPVASGSNPPDSMIICPCSMGTLAAVAHGMADNLIERAADVCLKERRPLIVVPREMPFSLIHLENMTTLTRAGACIIPPSPAFYHRPQTVEDLVDFVVARILDQLKIPHNLVARWGEQKKAQA